MSKKYDLIPVQTNDLDLNLVSEQFQTTKQIMEQLGIESATFKTGQTYKQDEQQTVLAADGIIVAEKENVTLIALRHKESSLEDAMRELNDTRFNQREVGAFLGKSQAWVSKSTNAEDEDEDD